MTRAFATLAWCLPYLVSGFSAPFIFRHARTLQQGGHFAGALFIFAGVWSLILAFRDGFPSGIKVFFVGVLSLQILFWSWRFFDETPLKLSSFLGINGSLWHGAMTTLYLLVALTLFFCEFRYRRSV
jgi:hypothetical protein